MEVKDAQFQEEPGQFHNIVPRFRGNGCAGHKEDQDFGKAVCCGWVDSPAKSSAVFGRKGAAAGTNNMYVLARQSEALLLK